MKSKLQWQGPYKKEQTLSEYFIANIPLGQIQIRFCNANNNISSESLMIGNPGQNHKIFNVSIMFEKFSENNITFSETEMFNCFNIVENWYQEKYQQLSQIFITNPTLQAATLIHQVLVNKYCNIAKEHEGKIPKEIPDCVKVNEALKVLEELFPETKFKG